MTLHCYTWSSVQWQKFAQTSAGERVKTFEIEKQLNIVSEQECIEDFQRFIKR